MEEEKLQRLHDTLAKLAPRGKSGGLGLNAFSKQGQKRDPTLPNNALYSYFVRAGSGGGQYHKRKFEEKGEADEEPEKTTKNKKKSKKKKSKLNDLVDEITAD